MGKQKGEAARSKARPSSSSQAASLLPAGAAAVGFGGYVGGTRLDATIRGDESVSFSEVDGEIAQHLKRLARKDPITKLKALSSLSTLLQQRSGKDIIPIIPQWVFEYKRLLMDYNREVRRSTHETMISLVNAVGRDLAPHLKSLMGPWWFSQFDSLSEVSQAAKQSFQVAFPTQDKRLDALMFCTEEIFVYLGDNLKLTPQSMSDLAAAADELSEMHHQVISSSLLALAALLDVLGNVQSERPETGNFVVEPKHVSKARTAAISSAGELFTAHKCFLTFLSSPSPAIRSAAYYVLRSYIKSVPQVLSESDIKSLSSAIYGAFQEKDQSCHAPMWETIVLFSRNFPASWSYINFQKTMLNHFWLFLRKGCYGSLQVSYPALVLFLDFLPLEAIAGEKFFLDFFQNFWSGRNFSHPSDAERRAFFLAYKECFLWALHVAPRICDGETAAHNFQISLISNILVKLLWHEYLFYIGSKHGDRVVLSGPGNSIRDSNQLSGRNLLELKSFDSYLQNLGQCMIEIHTAMNQSNHQFLGPFYEAFQNYCLKIFQETDHVDTSSDSLVRVIKFLFLLDQYAIQRGEVWPWDNLVGPLLEVSFPVISQNDLPAGIKFLTVVLSVFGPRKVILRLGSHAERCGIGAINDADEERDLKYFLQVYERTFVSWCMGANDCSSEALLDLLLALLEDECYSEQWNIAVSHITHKGHFEDMSTSDLARLTILTEKAQNMIMKRKAISDPECWRIKLLDSVALSIMHSPSPFGSYEARFIRAILGATLGDDRVLFVSKAAETQIYREALKKLLSFVINSPYAWVQKFGSLLSDTANLSPLEITSFVPVSNMAHFAVEVLDGFLFYSDLHSNGCEPISSIIAAVFIIDWECIVTSLSDTVDKSIEVKLMARKEFAKVLHDFRAKLSIPFLRALDMQSRRNLGSILVQFIRSVIFEGYGGNPDRIVSLCCQWIIEVVQSLCCDEVEEQNMLDLLLRSNDIWPLWIRVIRPNSSACERLTVVQPEKGLSNGQMNQGHIFVAVIDKVMTQIGIQKVIAGHIAQVSASDEKDTNELENPTTFGRVWLASEMLCTWKWCGGGAIGTILPLLSSYAKENDPRSNSFDSMVHVLLDGALLHGAPDKLRFFDSWHPSHDELDAIEEPFLRALICLLLMLFGDGIWGKESACEFFKLLMNKLYMGEAGNMTCLKILPPILHVLVRPLQTAASLSGDLSVDLHPDYSNLLEERLVDDWLPRALKLPCLISWKPGEDSEDWLQLVLSCYPLSVKDNLGVVKLDRVVCLSERRLLLELFHKQQYNSMESGSTSELQVAQVLLSRLVVVTVGYCSEEFEDKDWEFVLSQLRCWMEAVILPMEEAIEDLDRAAQKAALDSSKLVVDDTQQPILAIDTYHINAATNALYTYSLILGFVQCLEPAKDYKSLFLKSENCQHTMEQIEEGILRMFFSNGVAEGISRILCNGELSIMSDIHNAHPFFWKMLASVVVKSSPIAREEAVKSVERWGLSRDPISSLISILFSSTSATCLRSASFVLLSNAPISSQAIIKGNASSHVSETSSGIEVPHKPEISSEVSIALREEVSCMIVNLPVEILDMDLEAEERVKIFLSWSLLLSHLVTLPSSSPERERLVQLILDSASSVILDYLFQHLPLDLADSFKKKETELPSELSELAAAAQCAITSGSLVFAIESLWPIVPQKLAVLAAAIYSLILRLLPAYVRDWFGGLRDRSKSSAIKCFTQAWCSPYLIANELSQIKKLDFEDENFSISVSKSANEVVATYTKDETGLDLVIRLPACYPLWVVDAECTRSLGISEVKQRKWLVSMVSFVRNQNGALAEAIRIWKKNFDKAFKGVEDCPICFSVFHTSNHSLPRLACKTCKNKYHSACLYKWFSTSHKSTCPLCQSPF